MQARKRAQPALDQDGTRCWTCAAALANLALLGVSAFSKRRPTQSVTLGTGAIERFHAYFAHSRQGGLDREERRTIHRTWRQQAISDVVCSAFRAAVTILN